MKNITLFLLVLFLYGCDMRKHKGTNQISESIAESKRDSFFIKQYKLIRNDAQDFKISEAWIEKVWHYDAKSMFNIPKKAYDICQFVFKAEQTLLFDLALKTLLTGQ